MCPIIRARQRADPLQQGIIARNVYLCTGQSAQRNSPFQHSLFGIRKTRRPAIRTQGMKYFLHKLRAVGLACRIQVLRNDQVGQIRRQLLRADVADKCGQLLVADTHAMPPVA